MPNQFDGKPCKYGLAVTGYCNKKKKKAPSAKKPCKYGRSVGGPGDNVTAGFCNDRPADGRYGPPEPTDSLSGVPSNNPPETPSAQVTKAAKEIQKKAGVELGDKGWLVVATVVAGLATFAAFKYGQQQDKLLAAKFANRELQRVQRSIGRPLTEKEAAILTAQYVAFALGKFNDARMLDSKRPQDREKAFAGLNFRNSL